MTVPEAVTVPTVQTCLLWNISMEKLKCYLYLLGECILLKKVKKINSIKIEYNL